MADYLQRAIIVFRNWSFLKVTKRSYNISNKLKRSFSSHQYDNIKRLYRQNKLNTQFETQEEYFRKVISTFEVAKASNYFSLSTMHAFLRSYSFQPITDNNYAKLPVQLINTKEINDLSVLHSQSWQQAVEYLTQASNIFNNSQGTNLFQTTLADLKYVEPLFMEIVEQKLVNEPRWVNVQNFFDIIENAKLCDHYSKSFYEKYFHKIIQAMQINGFGAQEIVLLAKYYEDKIPEFEKYLNKEIRSNISSDIDKLQFTDMLTLLRMFQNDEPFQEYITKHFFDKLHKKEVISRDDLVNLFFQAAHLKNYRLQIINYMLNTEHFYSLKSHQLIKIFRNVLAFKLYSDDFKHFIQTMQVILAQRSDQINKFDFQRLISLHSIIPIYHVPFLGMLLSAYQVIHTQGQTYTNEVDIFNLNIQHINLPQISDPQIIEAYENCVALQFQRIQDVNFHTLFIFLIQNPSFANFGFHKSFSKTLFNMILAQKRSEKWICHTFVKLHILGVRDPQFLQLAKKMVEQNLKEIVKLNDYYILYNWWDLRNKKNHRTALALQVQYMVSNQGLSIPTQPLCFLFQAICDNEIETGKGPLFQYIFACLAQKSDFEYFDIQRMVFSIWQKDKDQNVDFSNEYLICLNKFENFFEDECKLEEEFDVLNRLDCEDLPAFPSEFSEKYFKLEESVLKRKLQDFQKQDCEQITNQWLERKIQNIENSFVLSNIEPNWFSIIRLRSNQFKSSGGIKRNQFSLIGVNELGINKLKSDAQRKIILSPIISSFKEEIQNKKQKI